MNIGILFLLLARTCIGDPIPPNQVYGYLNKNTPPINTCPEGWLQYLAWNQGHCFLFGSDGLGSWAEAKEYCKEKGGFLAEIPNEQTNTFLVDNMKTDSQLQKKWWWIGANDIANEGQFSWDNSGDSLEFDAWNNNNPDDWQEVGGEDCAALICKNKNKCFWNDIPCSGNYKIFKQWKLPAGGQGYPLCEIDTTQAAATNTNEHVNQLLQSTTATTPGWEINVEKGKWTNKQDVEAACGPQWYGWSSNSDVGSISTTLYKSSKCGKLDFGNCWNSDGTVRAYLAGKLIGEAGPNTPNLIIEFAIPEDSLLEIKDEGLSSVIKFTNFEMVDCSVETRNGEDQLNGQWNQHLDKVGSLEINL